MTTLLDCTIAMTLPGSGTQGSLVLPVDQAQGLVMFARGSGSSRFSRHNVFVAEALQRAGFATLLFDLLTEAEAAACCNVLNIPLLARRLDLAATAARWAAADPHLPLGFFGTGMAAAAALAAASVRADVAAIVSCGGRPDRVGATLTAVGAATLLIVGGRDARMLALNRAAYQALHCERRLEIVPGATHLFEEPGALDAIVTLATDWFQTHLAVPAAEREGNVF
jgi:putative phosphoribosyl transferase